MFTLYHTITYIINGGLIITYSHSFFGFSWLRSRLHFYVGIILTCGLTITTVIGSKLLSLGMIGAYHCKI